MDINWGDVFQKEDAPKATPFELKKMEMQSQPLEPKINVLAFNPDELVKTLDNRSAKFDDTSVAYWLKLTGVDTMLTPSGPWLAGGALRRTLLNQEMIDADLDFYFKNVVQLKAFQNKLEKIGYRLEKKTEFSEHWTKENSIKFNLVTYRWCSSPLSILYQFDLTVCQFAYDGKAIHTSLQAIIDLNDYKLRIYNIRDLPATMHRIFRLAGMGFHIDQDTINGVLKIAEERGIKNNYES